MQGIAVLSIRAGGRIQRLKPHSKQDQNLLRTELNSLALAA
jgi:hypothetical protein